MMQCIFDKVVHYASNKINLAFVLLVSSNYHKNSFGGAFILANVLMARMANMI